MDTSYRQRILLFHNEGNGVFSEVAADSGDVLMVPRVSRGAAFGDIDNDEDIDVIIDNLDGAPLILRNDSVSDNHWVTIKTVGKGMNHDAIGARVKVVSGDLVQWGEVHSGGSYLSSSDLRLHYGLGKRSRIDSIEAHWPGGNDRRRACGPFSNHRRREGRGKDQCSWQALNAQPERWVRPARTVLPNHRNVPRSRKGPLRAPCPGAAGALKRPADHIQYCRRQAESASARDDSNSGDDLDG